MRRGRNWYAPNGWKRMLCGARSRYIDRLMLKLRPNCEACDIDLLPAATNARICSYECTFCADCVETFLHNVCPNCGGGFVPRPIRPATARLSGVGLAHQPAAGDRVHLKYSREDVVEFVASLKAIPPALR